jgi:uncharacterized protein YdeI (YjbR/CyaY-like superfamily)
MKMNNTLSVETAGEWRAWLEQHHQLEPEVWLIFWKAHTGQPCISYADALDEALCYGWIDSLIQKIDEDRYARKFTPRTNTANWSEVNQRKVARLIRAGRMTPAGMEKLGSLTLADLEALEARPKAPRPAEVEVPEAIQAGLQASPLAWQNFCGLTPSQRRLYIGWISSAKRPETCNRRIQEAIARLEQNLPLGTK